MTYQNHKDWELSALVSADSFFYTLFQNSVPNELNERYNSELNDTLKEEMAQMNIVKSKFGVLNNHFSIVSHSEYDSDHLASFLVDQSGFESKNKIIRSDISEKFDVRVVYSVPRDLIKSINEQLSNPSLCHIVTALLDGVEYENRGKAQMDICFVKDQMILILSSDNQLQLANVYEISDPSSAIYFISLICNQQEFASEGIPIFLSGDIKQGDDRFRLISNYFSAATFRNHEMLKAMNTEDSQRFFPLICISQCA